MADWTTDPGGASGHRGPRDAVDDHRLGRLDPVDVRTVWSSESADFTPWLAANLHLLGDALGLDELELVQREVPVGPFYLDLLAKDAGGRTVVIENQLMPSEHGHLGQLLVYAAGRGAQVVVWVTTRFKEEYRAVLDWLNEHTDPDLAFFGVEVRVVRIGLSPPAPIFDPVVQPNDWGKAQKVQRQGVQSVSTVSLARQEFFRRVFDEIAERLPGFRVPKPSLQNWATFKAGPFGSYAVVFGQSGLRVEVYLDSGNKEPNKVLFDELRSDRAQIEASIGASLDWERLDEKRASRIAVYRKDPVRLDDEADTASAVAWAADQAIRFVKVLDRRLRSRARELRLNVPAGEEADTGTQEM